MTAKGAYVKKRPDRPKLDKIEEPSWRDMVWELFAHGHSRMRIANVLGCSKEKIYGIMESGSRPGWKEGQMLLDWHAKHMKAKESQLELTL